MKGRGIDSFGLFYVLSRPEISLHLGGLFMDHTDSKRKRRTQRDYTMGFKLQFVAAVEKGDMTYKQAQKIYGIQGRSTVLKWLRKHGKLDGIQPVRLAMPETPKAKETPPRKLNALNAN
jgi:transposase-like protein